MADERAPRVLMTADTVGGVWTYAVELARELDARGIAVLLATMGAPLKEHQRAQVAHLARVEVHESRYALEWMQLPWADVDAAGEWLLALERDWRPDVVHLNQFAFGALPFLAPTLVVAHSCVLSWWRAVRGGLAPAEWDAYRERVATGLRGAELVAAPTRAMLETLPLNYGYTGPGVVLPNGCAPEAFAPAERKREVVLAAGRFWDEAKNLAALEAVAPALPWPVQIAGMAAHPDGGGVLPTGVDFLGELPRAELAQRYAQAAIYALPARYEPFGLSVLEAGLSGCALVLGDIPTLREVWGPAAVYVPPDDTAQLYATLVRLMASPEERLRLAAAARERALLFHPQRKAQAYLAAYARLLPTFAAPREELSCA